MESLKIQTNRPYRMICLALKLNYFSFKRWKNRLNDRQPLLQRPGPKKISQLDAGHLEQKVKDLKHCRKRSHGTVNLYQIYKYSISRREFGNMVSMARYDANKEHRNNLRRIHWRVPGLVWSMDDTEWGHDKSGRKLYLHNLMDMSSSYKLRPIAGEFACGEGISANLVRHFNLYGPPLFQKRDNGGNLNHSCVNEVLEDYFVIPLNSPTYYPQYNGNIEAAQTEIKSAVGDKLRLSTVTPYEHFEVYTETAIYELNHLPRRKLRNKNSCQVFFEGKGQFKFSKRERKAIYEWILEKTNDIFEKMENKNNRALKSAYRIAVEAWLRKKGFIFVSINGKVLPYFQEKKDHN